MLTIIFGKVEEIRFFCLHRTLHSPSEYLFKRIYPQSIHDYLRYGEIEEPSIIPYGIFSPQAGIARWQEIKRSKDFSEHLVPDQDFIQINGRNYKIIEKGQRLDDGVMIYYIDHVVDRVENKESYKRAEQNAERINKLNKGIEDELRVKLKDHELAKKLAIQNQKPSFWKRLRKWFGG